MILDDRLKRLIQKARWHERKKTENFYKTKLQKKINRLTKEYDYKIKMKNKEIRLYQRQHSRDMRAYEMFKDERDFIHTLYCQMEPNFKHVLFSIGKIFQNFQMQHNSIELKKIRTEKKDEKIKKLFQSVINS